MTEKTYTHMDKTGWGEGAWNDEPDKVQWIDPASDLDCLIVRNRMGALCGYVGVPPGHPLHGKHVEDLDVHGGITFSASCNESGAEESAICHVPQAGRPDDVWWLGFDCAHGGDYIPGMEARLRDSGLPMPKPPFHDVYRDLGWVKTEVARLAAQLV